MNSIRKYVARDKVRLQEGEYDLDLTYITPRILAMSFPAADFVKKIYRNNISKVSQYLRENHGDNYFVCNMSGIEYDTTPFNGQVMTYDWEDHHSPTLHLLV